MGFFTPATLSETLGIAVDSEGIALEHAIRRAYERAMYCMGNELIADAVAIEVTSTLARRWQKESVRASAAVPKGYFVQPNRAFQIDITSFSKLNAYKTEWLTEYRSGRRNIDAETMALWFIDHIVNYGFKRHSSYAAVGTLKVLFNYDYEDIDEVLQRINERWLANFRKNKRDDLRRWKKKIFKSLIEWFGPDLLRIEDSERSDDLFIEHRFVKQTVTEQTFASACAALKFLTPLKPDCPFPEKRNIKPSELEGLLQSHGPSSEQALERKRIHLINHPQDLFSIVSLGSNTDMKDPDHYLEIPDFDLTRNDGEEPPPMDRQNLPELADNRRRRLEREVLKRMKRAAKLVLESVVIVVDDEERLEISLREPHNVQLSLKEGDSLVEIRGRDREGSLPLDAFFISWNHELADAEPLEYTLELEGESKINCIVNYERDAFGDLSGAMLEIQFRPVPQHSTHASPNAETWGAFSDNPLPRWFIPALGVLAIIMVGGLFVLLSWLNGAPSGGNFSGTAINSSSPVTTPIPSPSLPVEPSVASSTPQTAIATEIPPTPSAKAPGKIYYPGDELLTRANFLKLDDYHREVEVDRDVPTAKPPAKSSKSFFTIYASRATLTQVRIKVPERGVGGQPVVTLEDGFFRPVAPGNLEGIDDEILTVKFDLRTLPFQKYYLAVTYKNQVPKHYLVNLIDARVLPRQKRKQSGP